MAMEMKKSSKGRVCLFAAICVLALLLGILWFIHEIGYCATAADVEKIYLNNEQLFNDCKSALLKDTNVVYVSYSEHSGLYASCNTVLIDQVYFKTNNLPEDGSLAELAAAVNALNDNVALRDIRVRKAPIKVEFWLKTTNILNAVVLVYSEDGTFPDQYISDISQINAHWAAYITGD